MSRGHCGGMMPTTRTSTGGNSCSLDHRHVCFVTWMDTLTAWTGLCHTLTPKFKRIAPASFFIYFIAAAEEMEHVCTECTSACGC